MPSLDKHERCSYALVLTVADISRTADNDIFIYTFDKRFDVFIIKCFSPLARMFKAVEIDDVSFEDYTIF